MENIVLAIVPVRERSRVGTCQLNGLGSLSNFLSLGLCTLALFTLVLYLVRRGQIHPVWVDNFGLFLKIEGALMILHLSLSQLAVVVLTVVTEKRFWVGVPYEAVRAANCSRALVTSRDILNCRQITVSVEIKNISSRYTRKRTYRDSHSRWTVSVLAFRFHPLRGTLRNGGLVL